MRKLFFALFILSQPAFGHDCPCKCDQKPEPTKPKKLEYDLKSDKELKDGKVVLPEISGVARSYKHKDKYYVHNDSGGSARVFLISEKGDIEHDWDMDASARDWEDMTTAPCGKDRCLYIADFGDNGRKRGEYQIYEAKEPELNFKKLPTKKYEYKYDDGKSHNAEGFAYNPADGRFYIAKKDGAATLYQLPEKLSDKMEAKALCDLKEVKGLNRGVVTALDFNKDGLMLVRTYRHVLFYDGPCGKHLATEDYAKAGYHEKQGEAVSFSVDGNSWISVSEGKQPKVFKFEAK